jgi:hypothetical protein
MNPSARVEDLGADRLFVVMVIFRPFVSAALLRPASEDEPRRAGLHDTDVGQSYTFRPRWGRRFAAVDSIAIRPGQIQREGRTGAGATRLRRQRSML